MKVNGNLDSGALDKLSKPRNTQAGQEAGETEKTKKTVEASTLVDIKSEKVEAGETPFDEEKVEYFRKLIAEGKFTVDASNVADGMMASEVVSSKA